MSKLIFKSILVLVIIVANAKAFDFEVVINGELEIESVTVEELRNIYLGKKIFWKNNIKIEPTYCNCETTIKFIEDIVGKDFYKFNRYWRRKLFSGSGVPPKKFKNSNDLISFLSKNSGALGIIEKGDELKGNVKMVKITK